MLNDAVDASSPDYVGCYRCCLGHIKTCSGTGKPSPQPWASVGTSIGLE